MDCQLLHQPLISQEFLPEGVQLAGDSQVLDVGDDLDQFLQGLLGIALVLAKILLLAIEEIIFFVAADFQDYLPQVVGDLDDALLHLDGLEIVVGKAADDADAQDGSDQTDDHLLADVQMHGVLRNQLPVACCSQALKSKNIRRGTACCAHRGVGRTRRSTGED